MKTLGIFIIVCLITCFTALAANYNTIANDDAPPNDTSLLEARIATLEQEIIFHRNHLLVLTVMHCQLLGNMEALYGMPSTPLGDCVNFVLEETTNLALPKAGTPPLNSR
jgi:hypothetical protein